VETLETSERPKVSSTGSLRPLGTTAHLVCCVCGQQTARWLIMHARYGEAYICSLCFLYDSGWLDTSKAKAAVTRVINVLGLRRGKALECAESRLVRTEDADDVLGAVVLHARYAALIGRPA
jgi:predicted RNA-binding Zn-ribbon protein involved in translation (DUF1610 family)